MLLQKVIKRNLKHRRQPGEGKLLRNIDGNFNVAIFSQNAYELGKGGFGKCSLGKLCDMNGQQSFQDLQERYDQLQRNDRIVAVKTIPKYDQRIEELYHRQIKTMTVLFKSYNCPNIVKVFPYSLQSENNYYIVMEYCNQSNLSDFIANRKQNQRAITLFQFIQILLDLLNGYRILKESQIMHNDLKPANIFIKDKIFKIGDFGLACDRQREPFARVNGGTLSYSSPQRLLVKDKSKIYHQSDIFSLGLILYEIMFGQHPFTNRQYEHYHNMRMKQQRQKMSNVSQMSLSQEQQWLKVNKQKIYVQYMKQECPKIANKRSVLYFKQQVFGQLIAKLKKMILKMCAFQPLERGTIQSLLIQANQLNLSSYIKRQDLFSDLRQLRNSELRFQLGHQSFKIFERSDIRRQTIHTNLKNPNQKDLPQLLPLKMALMDVLYFVEKLIEMQKMIRELIKPEKFPNEEQVLIRIDIYCYELNRKWGQIALDYMRERGVSEEDVLKILRVIQENQDYLSQRVQIFIQENSLNNARESLLQVIKVQIQKTCVNSQNWPHIYLGLIIYEFIQAEQEQSAKSIAQRELTSKINPFVVHVSLLKLQQISQNQFKQVLGFIMQEKYETLFGHVNEIDCD